MSRMFQNRLAALVLAGTMMMGTGSMAPALSQHAEHLKNTLTVQGLGMVTAQPDSVQVDVAVETDGKTAEAARTENARKMTTVVGRLKSLGIPNLTLKTTGFSVYPIHSNEYGPVRENRPPKIVAYRAHNNLQLKVEGASAEQLSDYGSRIVDTAVAAGATHSGGVSFFLSRNNKATSEALELAVQQARQHAEALARGAGLKITGISSIEAFPQAYPMPMMARSSVMMADGATEKASTPMEPGNLDITANVTVRFTFSQ